MFEKVGKSGNFEVKIDSLIAQNQLVCAAVDSTGSFLYGGSWSGPNALYKINNDSLTKIAEHTDIANLIQAQFHPQRNEIFLYYANGGKFCWGRYSYDKNTGIMTKIQEVVSSSTFSSTFFIDVYGKFFYGLEGDTAQIRKYDVATVNGSLNSLGTVAVSGTIPNPRGLICHPNGKFLYVVNTNTLAIQTYSINQITGTLTSLGTTSITGSNSPSTMICDPTGKFLYISDPGINTIFCYTINQTTGALTSAGTIVSGTGAVGFYIEMFCESTGKFLYATNNSSNTVSTYTINQTTGMLTFSGTISITSPSYVICDPTSKFTYIGNNAGISYYTINSTTGLLNYVGSIAQTSIAGFYCDPTGNFLYVAIAAGFNCSFRSYAINQSTGGLTLMVVSNCSAQSIGFFRGDPAGKFLYIADWGSGTAQSYAIDKNTGNINFTGTYNLAGTPWGVITSANGNYAYVSVTGSPYNITMYSINNGFSYLTTTSVSVTSPFMVKGDSLGKWLYVGGNNASNTATLQAYSINQTTGALTAAGAALTLEPSSTVYDIIIDKYNKFLYATMSSLTQQIYLYTINQSTGALTFVSGYTTSAGYAQPYNFSAIDSNNDYFYFCCGSVFLAVFSINQSTGVLTLYNNYYSNLMVSQLFNIPNKNRYFVGSIEWNVGLLLLYSNYSTSISSDIKKIQTKKQLPYDVKEKITDPIKRNPVYWGN